MLPIACFSACSYVSPSSALARAMWTRTTSSSSSHPSEPAPSALRCPCRVPQRPAMAPVCHSRPPSSLVSARMAMARAGSLLPRGSTIAEPKSCAEPLAPPGYYPSACAGPQSPMSLLFLPCFRSQHITSRRCLFLSRSGPAPCHFHPPGSPAADAPAKLRRSVRLPAVVPRR